MAKIELGNNPLIWWTTQADCNQIGNPNDQRSKWKRSPLNQLPSYIAEEFNARCGRSGRGRLWISPDFDSQDIHVSSAYFDQDRPLIQAIARLCGGIVIRREDGPVLCSYPGIITDFTLEAWTPEITS